MECLGRKRKGVEYKDTTSSSELILSYVSLEDYSKRKKKCRELAIEDTKNIVKVAATAPSCSTARSNPRNRGLKRKIGCIESATSLGRKKKIEQEYELCEIIGKGKFGSVTLCRSKSTKEELACKTLHKRDESVHREVEIMQHLSGNQGVVTLKSVYEDTESFHLVMELCPGGRLLDQMVKERRYTEQKVAMIMKELMMTIKYCHEMGVVHRDIKPENILVSLTGKLKLADFGLAVRVSDGQNLRGIVGSPAYIAPEILTGEYSKKVDIWSAGVLLHTLLTGVLPFRGDCVETVFNAIKNESVDFSDGIWEFVSPPARSLVSKMLNKDVFARFSAQQVLMHPWILFYTEPTLKTLTPKPDTKNHARLLSTKESTSLPEAKSKRTKARNTSYCNDNSAPIMLRGSSTNLQSGVHVEFSLVDVLTVAISRVRISEPKRSRLCSSNINSINLCTAF